MKQRIAGRSITAEEEKAVKTKCDEMKKNTQEVIKKAEEEFHEKTKDVMEFCQSIPQQIPPAKGDPDNLPVLFQILKDKVPTDSLKASWNDIEQVILQGRGINSISIDANEQVAKLKKHLEGLKEEIQHAPPPQHKM